MKSKTKFIGIIALTAIMLFGFFKAAPKAQAKASSRITLVSHNGTKVPFKYTSKKNKSINVTHNYTLSTKDGGYSSGTASLKLKSLTYYKLKSNKFGRKTNVRLYFLAKSNNAKDYTLFNSKSSDMYQVGYINTTNGLRLHQSVETDEQGPVTLHGHDAEAFHVDFTSNQRVPYSKIISATIHFYASVGGEQNETFEY